MKNRSKKGVRNGKGFDCEKAAMLCSNMKIKVVKTSDTISSSVCGNWRSNDDRTNQSNENHNAKNQIKQK